MDADAQRAFARADEDALLAEAGDQRAAIDAGRPQPEQMRGMPPRRPEAERRRALRQAPGQRRQMRKAGKLKFTLHGQTYTLTAFVTADDVARRQLFVPFRDLTAGLETYASGRYLDLDRTPTGLYDLDFNTAYQPYCYYDAKYDCPIPPQENRLSVPIRAGERMRRE